MSWKLAFETWGGCLTRRDGAKDIAEHISATAVNDTNVLGEVKRESEARSKLRCHTFSVHVNLHCSPRCQPPTAPIKALNQKERYKTARNDLT